jgi:hypothetical protein
MVYVNVVAGGTPCKVSSVNYVSPTNPMYFGYTDPTITIANPYTYSTSPTGCTPTATVTLSFSPNPGTGWDCVLISGNDFKISSLTACALSDVLPYTLTWSVSVAASDTVSTTAITQTNSITLNIICKVSSVSYTAPASPQTFGIGDAPLSLLNPYTVTPASCASNAVFTPTFSPVAGSASCLLVSGVNILISSVAMSPCVLSDVKSYTLTWQASVPASYTSSGSAISQTNAITLNIVCRVSSISFASPANPQTFFVGDATMTITNPYTVSPAECTSQAVITLSVSPDPGVNWSCVIASGNDFQV